MVSSDTQRADMPDDTPQDATEYAAPANVNYVRTKAALFFAVVLAIAGALGWRLVDLQVLRHGDFRRIARNIHTTSISVTQRRGDILTSDGKLLARSVARPSVFVDPSLLKNPADRQQVALDLAGALGKDPLKIYRDISERLDRRFIWIERQIDPVEEVRIASLLESGRRGVGAIREYKRVYPSNDEGAHLVGITDIDGNGLAGIERMYDEVLDGEEASVTMAVDGRRHTIATLGELPADAGRHGHSLVLTIDSVIQHYVEQQAQAIVDEYKPKGLVVVVMDVNSGDVLGMTSRPTYNPNDPGAVPSRHWVNGAVSNAYEIGSVFKPIVMAIALEEGIVHPDDRIFCHDGLYRSGRRSLHDHHPYGWLTAREVIWKSSNIGMAKIGEALGNERMYDRLKAFGFGEPTGIELPSESPGRMLPLDRWTSYSTTSIPMGHEIMVTPLQVARAFSAIANGGWLVKPRLVKLAYDADGNPVTEPPKPQRVRRVLSREVSKRMMQQFLSGVVYHGTGKKAQLDHYTVGGKTGTGQKVIDGRYSHSKYVSSFVCVGPVEKPEVCVLVVVDEPTAGRSHYGGTVAAPGAAKIMERTLEFMGVRPEMTPEQLKLALRPEPENR